MATAGAIQLSQPTLKKRHLEIDLLKFYLLIRMPMNHVWHFLGNPAPMSEISAYGFFMDFFSNTAAASLFMFVMGMCFLYSRNQEPKGYLKRGGKIFCYGILLNLFRDTIPYLLLMKGANSIYPVPQTSYVEFVEQYDYIDGALCGDILVFAGLAMMIFAFFKWIKANDLTMILITVAFYIIGQFTYPNVEIAEWNLLVRYFIDANFAFTICSWMPFVIAGYLFSKYLPNIEEQRAKGYMKMAIIGAVLLGVFFIFKNITGNPYNGVHASYAEFQGQPPLAMTLSFAVMFLFFPLIYLISRAITGAKATAFIMHISSLVNNIYIAQWLILGWTLAILYRIGVPLQLHNDCAAAFYGLLLVASSWVVAHFYNKLKLKNRS